MDLQKDIWDLEYSKHSLKWKRERRDIPNIMKGKRVLEVGVGNGKNLYEILRQKPKSLVAIDYSSKALTLCKKIFAGNKINFVERSIVNTGFREGSFEVVLCHYVLNNLLKDERKNAIREIKRILCKKGVIILEDFMVGDLRYKKQQKEIEKNTFVKKNGLICHFFSEKEILSLLKDFKIIELKSKEFRVVLKDPASVRKLICVKAMKI